MFSSADFMRELQSGQIEISNFDPERLNPNSYDVILGNWFYLLHPDTHCNVRYYGPLYVADGDQILVPSGMTLLGMTKDRLASYGDILGQLRSKSSTRREGVTVCDDAGFGDCGYANHWAVELSSHVSGQGVYLTVGQRFAQILYQRTETPPIRAYSGQYNAADWPSCMLPKKHRGKELPWPMLEKHSPFLGLLLWVKVGPTSAKAGTRYACTVTSKATGEVRYAGSVVADNPGNAEILAAMAADLDSFDLPHYTIEVVEAQ
jgi:deoxycytidine triphosphate deaminase